MGFSNRLKHRVGDPTIVALTVTAAQEKAAKDRQIFMANVNHRVSLLHAAAREVFVAEPVTELIQVAEQAGVLKSWRRPGSYAIGKSLRTTIPAQLPSDNTSILAAQVLPERKNRGVRRPNYRSWDEQVSLGVELVHAPPGISDPAGLWEEHQYNGTSMADIPHQRTQLVARFACGPMGSFEPDDIVSLKNTVKRTRTTWTGKASLEHPVALIATELPVAGDEAIRHALQGYAPNEDPYFFADGATRANEFITEHYVQAGRLVCALTRRVQELRWAVGDEEAKRQLLADESIFPPHPSDPRP